MKYLKKFESNSTTMYNELEELCTNTIPYILDNIPDFTFNITEFTHNDKFSLIRNGVSVDLTDQVYQISFTRRTTFRRISKYSGKFSWKIVKANLIPFFILLNKRYEVISLDTDWESRDEILEIDDVINDNVDNNRKFLYIIINVKEKK